MIRYKNKRRANWSKIKTTKLNNCIDWRRTQREKVARLKQKEKNRWPLASLASAMGQGRGSGRWAGRVTDRFHEEFGAMQHQTTIFRVVATRELQTLYLRPPIVTHSHTQQTIFYIYFIINIDKSTNTNK